MNYEILFHPEARNDFLALDGAQRKLVAKQIAKIGQHPELGEDLGNKQGIDLSGYRKRYADKKKIRIIYEIIEDRVVIRIIAIGKREDLEVYREAFKRVAKQ